MAAVPHSLFSIEPLEEVAKVAAPPQQRPQQAQQVPQQRQQDHAVGALMLGLKALSQGAIIAASRFTNLAMVVSVFWLFMSISSPNQLQIIWGGMYSLFILTGLWLINRGRG